ncbi:MAG: hypothetical protein R3B96_02145 [Pirellulaceae bacterium]
MSVRLIARDQRLTHLEARLIRLGARLCLSHLASQVADRIPSDGKVASSLSALLVGGE